MPESAGDGDAKVEDKKVGDEDAEVEVKEAKSGRSKKGKKKGKKLTRSHAVLARLRKQHERVVAQRIRYRQRQLQAGMSHAVAVRSKFAKTVSARAAGRGLFVPREERLCMFARAQPGVHVVFVPWLPCLHGFVHRWLTFGSVCIRLCLGGCGGGRARVAWCWGHACVSGGGST